MMAASVEMTLNSTLHLALTRRQALQRTILSEREATIAFMDAALHSHWSWESIGRALEISGTAARRYYERNRRKVRSGATRPLT